MIKNNEDLIEHLEAIRTELQPRRLAPGEYESVGWADRPLRELIDEARRVAEQESWTIHRSMEFARKVLP